MRYPLPLSERKGNEFSLVARTELNDNLKKEAIGECIATEFSENRYNKIIKSIEEAEKELCIYKMVEENIEVVYDEIASEMGKHYEKEFRSLETQIECLKKIEKEVKLNERNN